MQIICIYKIDNKVLIFRYWALQLYLQVLTKNDHSQRKLGVFSLLAAYFIHVLPYFHAALNPTLYLYLNKHIRQSVKTAQQSIRSFVSQKAESSRRRLTRSRSCPVKDSPEFSTVRKGLRMTVFNPEELAVDSPCSSPIAIENVTKYSHCPMSAISLTPTSLKRRLHFSFSETHRRSIQL